MCEYSRRKHIEASSSSSHSIPIYLPSPILHDSLFLSLYSTLSIFRLLYISVNAPGVAADISHINTPSVVKGYLPADDGLKNALTGADIVVIPAGVPRKVSLIESIYFPIESRELSASSLAWASRKDWSFGESSQAWESKRFEFFQALQDSIETDSQD